MDARAGGFASAGVDAVGLDELMEEAGLTLGGSYQYFPSRSAVPEEDGARFNSVERGAIAQ